MSNGVDGVNAVAHGVGVGNEANGVNDVQLCPHCRQPIALVTLLLTRNAAHVTVPDPPSRSFGRRGTPPLVTDTLMKSHRGHHHPVTSA